MKYNNNALALYNLLKDDGIIGSVGKITFKLAHTSVDISTTDTVGQSLQSWLKQYMLDKNIVFMEMDNTQEFPDFILDPIDRENNLLEVKAFNYNAGPGFDIANFESYCDSVRKKPYRLNADYLIFGYSMTGAEIKIENIWIKKIWEISSSSGPHPLKVQDKRGMIYNIRPCKWYGTNNNRFPAFTSQEQFIKAIYNTLKEYQHSRINADEWLSDLKMNYKKYYNKALDV